MPAGALTCARACRNVVYGNAEPHSTRGRYLAVMIPLRSLTQLLVLVGAAGVLAGETAQAQIDQLNKAHVFSGPIVTQVAPFEHFYPAEHYHQNYLALHPDQPYIVFNDLPKLRRLKEQFPALYRQ